MDLIIIQARMGSSRLPGKMLLPILGDPLIIFLLKKLNIHFDKKNIIIATSKNIENDILEKVCKKNGYQVFRGDENDVLSRFVLINNSIKSKNIIRLTGDNPMIDINLIKEVLKFHKSNDFDFTSTREVIDKKIVRYAPKGKSVDVFKSNLLKNLNINSLSDFDKEHVIPFFYSNHFKYGIYKSNQENNISSIENYSIDTSEDYLRIKKIIEQ